MLQTNNKPTEARLKKSSDTEGERKQATEGQDGHQA